MFWDFSFFWDMFFLTGSFYYWGWAGLWCSSFHAKKYEQVCFFMYRNWNPFILWSWVFFLILGNSQALFLQRFPSFLILQILLLCRYSDLQSLHCLGFFFCVVCIFHYHFILLSVPALSFAHIFFDLYLTWPFRSLFCFSVTYILLFNISIKAQSRG